MFECPRNFLGIPANFLAFRPRRTYEYRLNKSRITDTESYLCSSSKRYYYPSRQNNKGNKTTSGNYRGNKTLGSPVLSNLLEMILLLDLAYRKICILTEEEGLRNTWTTVVCDKGSTVCMTRSLAPPLRTQLQ